jgi:hypothetical protein
MIRFALSLFAAMTLLAGTLSLNHQPSSSPNSTVQVTDGPSCGPDESCAVHG